MPLKHTTETFFVFLLGTAIVATGVVIPTLTALNAGIVPWAIVFVVAAAYPLLLSRTFRNNRADYTFRILHWMPAILLLFLLFLEAVVYAFPSALFLLDWYAWGWTLFGVAVGFFLLAAFCARVMRRWSLRIFLISIIFIPFIMGAVAAEHFEWNREIAATLWEGDWWQIGGDPDALLADINDGANLDASSDPAEERYRDRLRAIEGRRERISKRLDERRGEDSSLGAVGSVSSPNVEIRQVSSMPSSLPSSGFGWATIIVTMLGLYTAAVHASTRKRTVEVFLS